jgi:hypothetical protein
VRLQEGKLEGLVAVQLSKVAHEDVEGVSEGR